MRDFKLASRRDWDPCSFGTTSDDLNQSTNEQTNQLINQPYIYKVEAKDEKSQSKHNFYPRTNQLHVSATHTHTHIYK